MKLQKKQKVALASWVAGKRGPEETEKMHAALGPHLTESILDAVLAGKLDTIDEIADVEEKPKAVDPLASLTADQVAAVQAIVDAAVAKVKGR
jgi:hypothetical protein